MSELPVGPSLVSRPPLVAGGREVDETANELALGGAGRLFGREERAVGLEAVAALEEAPAPGEGEFETALGREPVESGRHGRPPYGASR